MMKEKNLPEYSKELFTAYLGLEMEMSLVTHNRIESYWSSSHFLGQKTL